jgi:hypothetical protein
VSFQSWFFDQARYPKTPVPTPNRTVPVTPDHHQRDRLLAPFSGGGGATAAMASGSVSS